VNGSGLGVLDGKTSGYFLTSVASGYLIRVYQRLCTDYSDVGSWSSGPKPPSQVSAGISIFCLNSTSGLNSISSSTLIPRPPRARDRVTMAEDGPALQDGSWRVSDRFPGALGRNPTCRTDRCDLRYGLDQSPCPLPAVIVKLLIDLGKTEQTAEARM